MIEVTELYCQVGTCLCTTFRQESNDPRKCECGHALDDHEENRDPDDD